VEEEEREEGVAVVVVGRRATAPAGAVVVMAFFLGCLSLLRRSTVVGLHWRYRVRRYTVRM
jgi:hypothetical protein